MTGCGETGTSCAMNTEQVTPLKRIMDEEGRRYSWLADELGVSRSRVREWLKGWHKPVQPRREEIARVLGRTVDELWPPDQLDRAA